MLNPSVLVESVNGNVPSGACEMSEELLEGRTQQGSTRAKGFPTL